MTSQPPLPLPALELDCGRCGGRGWYLEQGEEQRCGVCNGAGFVPTAFGEQVLALMRHNLRPMLADAHVGCLGHVG